MPPTTNDVALRCSATELSGTAGRDIALVIAPRYVSGRIGEDRVAVNRSETHWSGIVGSRDAALNAIDGHWSGKVGEERVLVHLDEGHLSGEIGDVAVDVTLDGDAANGAGPELVALLIACSLA